VSDQQSPAETQGITIGRDSRRRHNRWMVFWTAIGSIAAVGGAVAGLAIKSHDGGGSTPLVVIPTVTAGPDRSDSPTASASASATPSGPELTEAQRMLFNRVKDHTDGCDGVEDGSEIQYADAVLTCDVQDERPDSPIIVASFTAVDGFDAFMSGQEDEEQIAEDDEDPFAEQKDWFVRDSDGNDTRIGEYISYHDADGKAWIIWSFENDAFKSTYDKNFVVLASGSDENALGEWWNSLPI
jgi:hypothetical protein